MSKRRKYIAAEKNYMLGGKTVGGDLKSLDGDSKLYVGDNNPP